MRLSEARFLKKVIICIIKMKSILEQYVILIIVSSFPFNSYDYNTIHFTELQ